MGGEKTKPPETSKSVVEKTEKSIWGKIGSKIPTPGISTPQDLSDLNEAVDLSAASEQISASDASAANAKVPVPSRSTPQEIGLNIQENTYMSKASKAPVHILDQ